MWAVRFRTFLQKRFAKFSKGGGDWPPLAESTIRRKSKRKGKRGQGSPSAILRDTDALFKAVAPEFTGAPGAVETFTRTSVIVGYGGSAQYSSGTAIMDVAEWHDKGNSRLPRRVIIVPPDQATRQAMANAAQKEYGRDAKKMIG